MTLSLIAFSIMTVVYADLADLKWKSRVLVLLAESAADPRLVEQRARLEREAAGMKERDLVVLQEVTSGPLHTRFGVRAGFAAVLIGKDGGEKWRATDNFDPQEVFALIETMPMRARERRPPE